MVAPIVLIYPMPVEHLGERVILKHPKGPSADILLYGATVISWKSGGSQSPTPVERLFVSSKAKLDGSKPVRGGIPVVFPCFGAPVHPEHMQLGQHGFARNQSWEWAGTILDNESVVSVQFSLGPTSHIQSVYERLFRLTYIVTLAENQLSTDLRVENTSSDEMEFQALFHNYILAPSNDVSIVPLRHLTYFDKTDTTADGQPRQKIESRSVVDVRSTTDSVYENAPQDYTILWGTRGIRIKTTNLKDVVIWNPQEEGGKMADMEEGGWSKYVCVEPGFVKGFVRLPPKGQWAGQQTMIVVDE